MEKDTESRYWCLEINNPKEKGFDHDTIVDILDKGAKLRYYCLSDEIGKSGTYHTHIYLCYHNNVKFSTIKNKFPEAHIEESKGNPESNRDYVFKQGKWEGTEKEVTNLKDTHLEYGICPVIRQGKRNDLSGLYDMIKEGMSNYEIFERDPNMMRHVDKIDKVRKTILAEEVKNKWRNVDVTYIWGTTGAGKTRYVMDKYGYDKVYRVTDYKNPFDGYSGQKIILFEEFRSSLRIEDMLKYLDGYPVELACRYSNQMALFDKVYFCTNIDVMSQYRNIQNEEPETWKAFLRRIDRIAFFNDEARYVADTEDYLKNVFTYFDNPFENCVQSELKL